MKGVFAKLLTNPMDLQRVAVHIEDTLWRSFAEDRAEPGGAGLPWPPTEREIERRVEIYTHWFAVFHGDMKYSLMKTLDLLPIALRRALRGQPIEPTTRPVWVAPAGPEYLTVEERERIRALREVKP